MAEKKITLPVVNLAGEKVGDVKVSAEVFGITDANEQPVHDAVVAQLANARQATAKTKKRHEVSGGGKKPWRQKGTGRARAGSSRSPIWVGGGKVFGPDGNQNYTVYQNKKAHALAMKTVLSQKVAAKKLIVVDSLDVEAISTKNAVAALANIKAEGKITVVCTAEEEKFIYSAANIDNVTLLDRDNVSVYDVLNANCLVVCKQDVEYIEGGLK
ncbi:MAG: 50S ribosomal protein L4 [Bacilli bacterium]|nr:50S ribosomal protein L4 [Bacilli bacterium]